jgi:hypothetical protein
VGLVDEEFLTVFEVAELLKLNQQTVRNSTRATCRLFASADASGSGGQT